MIDRRHFLGTAGALMLGTALPALAQDATPATRFTGDHVIGSADAPLTVVEYFSFTCPHCAAFHRVTWPEVKKAYVDTGKVRFIKREVYFDRLGLAASLVSRCAGEAGVTPMTDMLLKRQDDWARTNDPLGALAKIARLNGLSEEEMTACITDRDFAAEMVGKYQKNVEADQIKSTPSFLIGGELTSGNMGFDEFAALLDKNL